MTLGKRLMALRKKHNLTQNEVAKYLSVSRGAVSMWEINQRTPDPETLKQIATLFNVSLDWLMGHQQEEKTLSFFDDLTYELPQEARRSLLEFREYLLEKYRKK